MTTLRRVLLQSAKEAGPPTFERQSSTASAASSATRPTTPHTGKSTSHRHHSASDEGSSGDEARSVGRSSLGKRRRMSRGWEDASVTASKEQELRSPRSESSRSPRLAALKVPLQPTSLTSTLPEKQGSDDDEEFDEDEVMAIAAPSQEAITSLSQIPTTKTNPSEPDDASSIQDRPELDGQAREEEVRDRVAVFPAAYPALLPVKEEPHTQVDERAVSTLGDSGHQGPAAVVTRRPSRQSSPPAPKESARPIRLPAPPPVRPEPSERRAARPSMANGPNQETVGRSAPPISGIIEQEWVMCEDCKKWRKLPLNITAASLPEKWYCHMNSWNAALASCAAPVEEGSEETPDCGLSESLQLAKKNYALPPGINLYGGQVQLPLTAAPAGAKQPRSSTYRELIGSHYRSNKPFIMSFSATCDARYGGFPTYVSPSLRPRAFDDVRGLLAFPRLGWVSTGPASTSDSRTSMPFKVQAKGSAH